MASAASTLTHDRRRERSANGGQLASQRGVAECGQHKGGSCVIALARFGGPHREVDVAEGSVLTTVREHAKQWANERLGNCHAHLPTSEVFAVPRQRGRRL